VAAGPVLDPASTFTHLRYTGVLWPSHGFWPGHGRRLTDGRGTGYKYVNVVPTKLNMHVLCWVWQIEVCRLTFPTLCSFAKPDTY
jgi:hypothetical protein